MQYSEIFESFPPELRLPLARLVDTLREELSVRQVDFTDLRAIVGNLAQSQQRTDEAIQNLIQTQQQMEARMDARMEALAQTQRQMDVRMDARLEALAQSQQRTDEMIQQLMQSQQRADERGARIDAQLEALAQSQQRADERGAQLDARLEALAQSQQRTDETVEKAVQEMRTSVRRMEQAIGGLGARWGLQTEEAFRQGMRAVLQEVGFSTERFLDYDASGEVFGHPEQIELDVVVKNSKVIVIEIKSALDRGNTYLFDRKVAFYARKIGRNVSRKLIVTPYADNRAKETALRLGVEVCSEVETLN